MYADLIGNYKNYWIKSQQDNKVKKLMDKIPELHKKVLEKAKSEKLGQYVWKYGAGPQMGYSFSIV